MKDWILVLCTSTWRGSIPWCAMPGHFSPKSEGSVVVAHMLYLFLFDSSPNEHPWSKWNSILGHEVRTRMVAVNRSHQTKEYCCMSLHHWCVSVQNCNVNETTELELEHANVIIDQKKSLNIAKRQNISESWVLLPSNWINSQEQVNAGFWTNNKVKLNCEKMCHQPFGDAFLNINMCSYKVDKFLSCHL